jgi:hypothetical protein
MSTLKVLKEYLVGDGGYLLEDDNNGKTVMLSGAWGSGKTHFWQNGIEPELSKKLKKDNKACVYVSLYGKDNIEAIKNEILFKAYESIKDENKLAKRAISAFGFGSRLLSVSVGGVRANTSAVGDAVKGFFESKKIDEAESFLADGGLIWLDDFERKSKHIDLNDLFGFIAQLAIDMNCKVVIILNSDVFEGEEANVFKTVKEKTVNKFFYFEPSIEELFNSIYNSHEKYKKLDEYKDKILNAIKETEELNARIYIQVLDNCLEWIEKGHSDKVLNLIVLYTVSFIKNHFILKRTTKERTHKGQPSKGHHYSDSLGRTYTIMDSYPEIVYQFFDALSDTRIDEFSVDILTSSLKQYISEADKWNDDIASWVNDNIVELEGVYKYGYKLHNSDYDNEDIYFDIVNFIKSGILLQKSKESL